MHVFKTFRSLLLLLALPATAQLNTPALVGYWHNWDAPPANYLSLSEIDSRYTVIDLAFAVPAAGTDYAMEFIPSAESPAQIQADIASLQAQGKQVLISIGGANGAIHLDNTSERDAFVASMMNILSTYGFDGMDIDLEGASLLVSSGTITNPGDAAVLHLIDAVQDIMQQYRANTGRKMLLTAAPETAFVQGGQSAYGGIWGAYLPVLHALRDSMDLLHVQLYNSGSMYGLDGGIYTQGTADFIVSQTEAVIRGFTTGGGLFEGFPASKIAVGLPACNLAAGGGYTQPGDVEAAMRYLLGSGPQPGAYALLQNGGYPNLGGMMTWSINWDAAASCNGAYSYAQVFDTVFGLVTEARNPASGALVLRPNPGSRNQGFFVSKVPAGGADVYTLQGQHLVHVAEGFEGWLLPMESWAPGVYIWRDGGGAARWMLCD